MRHDQQRLRVPQQEVLPEPPRLRSSTGLLTARSAPCTACLRCLAGSGVCATAVSQCVKGEKDAGRRASSQSTACRSRWLVGSSSSSRSGSTKSARASCAAHSASGAAPAPARCEWPALPPALRAALGRSGQHAGTPGARQRPVRRACARQAPRPAAPSQAGRQTPHRRPAAAGRTATRMRQPPLNVCVARCCMSGSKESPARMAAARASAPCASISSSRLYTWRRAGQLAPLRPWLPLQPQPAWSLTAAEPLLPRAVSIAQAGTAQSQPSRKQATCMPCRSRRHTPATTTAHRSTPVTGPPAHLRWPSCTQADSDYRWRTSTRRAVASGAAAAPPAALPPALAFPAAAPALAAPAARPLVPAAAPVSARMSAGGATCRGGASAELARPSCTTGCYPSQGLAQAPSVL